MSLHQVKGLFFIIILKLTIELATCQECADQPPPFGMESGAIQNSQITSSSFASGYPPYSARLNNYYGAWCSSSLSTGEWLQIDLGNDKELLAIATEGFFSSYVTSYYLMYSFDKTKWYCFGYEGVAKKLSGSTVSTTHVLHNKPVVRYVRINPITWVGKICLKTELYGCPSPGRPVQSSMPETCNVLNENPTTFPPTTLAPVVGETTTLAEGVTAGSTKSTTPVTTPEPTTELTTTIAPITWEPIDSIKIRVTSTSGVQVSTVYVGQTVLIGIFYHKGSDVMYNWNFGDGSTKQTDAGTFKYEYKAAGIYTLSVLGYNEVSNATNHFLITVQDQITGLKFIGKSNAMVPNTSFTFQWNIDKGTNVTYTIKYGDETPDTKISSVEVGPGPYSLVHKYVNTGHYRIQITAVNLISTAVPIHNKVIIEDKLKGLKVKWELPRRVKYNTKRLFIAVGEEITVKMSLEFGTDPLYKVDFGERKIDLGSRSYVNFQYSLNGTYSITAYTYNHVSALSQSYPIVINVQNDEMISGLKLSSSPTQFGFSTSIVLSVKSGTAFVCYWSFGDGLTALRDVTNFNDAMYHTYDSAGFYELNVCCENKHGNYCVQDTAAVLIPIISPSISAILKPMKSNSTQLFEITLMNGSDVTFDVMFGDGKSIRLHLPNTTARDQDLHINHTYEKPGVYYMMVHVYNKLGGIRTKLTDPIIVQNPLRANTLSLQNKNPVKIPDGRVIFTLELLEEVYHPTNVSCFWNFGDNRTTEIHSSVTEKIAHTFAEKGRYIVHVICKNRVSSKSISTNVIIYRMITPQIAIDSQTKIIDGSPQMMFLLSGENVTFCVTTQPYDRFYIWSGVDRTVSIETRLACIKRIINEARLYNIKVVVNNSLEIMTRMESFRVQKATHGLKISSNGSTIVRELAKLTWTAEIFGTDACFFINFNDSSDDMIYGPPSCSAKSIQLPLQGANREILIRHKYMQDGQYNVTIKAKNIVSSLTAQTYVTIIKPVCKILSIKISWNGKTNDEFTYLRSESFELYVEYKKQCYFGEGVDISWKLFKNSSGVETAVNLNSLQTRRKKYLSFGSLDLAYGYYRVVVTIKLTGSALQEIYGDVINFKSSFIHINPSPLQAKIKGGSFVMVDPDSSFTLDGGSSIDPDEYIPYLNLKYRWFCKRKLKHSDTFVGCYSSNKNYLEPIGFDRLLFTVSKELIRNTSYLFTLEVYKGSRTARAHQTVFVTFGLPPAMKIMCIPTCDGRLIPSKSLVLLGECTSCGSSDVSLGYKWELAEVINKTQKPRNTLPSETRYGLNTARFELLPNLLPPGKHFISTLSAWKRGGLPGYTTYTFVVYKNSPPKDGNCSVIPAQGNAMDTSFVVHCFDWLDQDPPLSYAFSYTLGEETTLLYSGDQNQRSFKLPIAEGADNSTINITSELTDSLGMSAVAWTTVLVSKPKKIDISNILNVIGGGAGGGIGGGGSGSSNGGSNGGSSSGGSGGSGAGSASKNQTVPKKSAAEVAQLANLVAYSLNNAGSGDDNDKKNEEDVNKAKQLRQTVASQMEDTISDMKNNNATKITDLDLVTSSLRALTKNPKELTMTALGDIANSLSDIGLTLKRLADLARKDSLTEAERLKIIQQIKNVAGKILETISNIMMGITALSESCNTLSPYEETVIKVKSMIAKVIDTLDEIAIILLSFMKVGDPKFVMKTDFANITLERNHGQSISDRNYSFTRGSIDLPKTDKLLPSYNMSSVDVIDLKIMEYNNVYQFCESPEDLISGLLHFNLLQANGSNHDITNTKEFIQVNISHSPQALPASNFSERYYVDPLNGTTRFHRINWTSPETAVNIEFLPNSSYLIKWYMYVVYGEKVLSGEPPVLTVYSSNETDTIYVLQLSRNRYRETGLYKIYLKMDLSDEVEELWKADQVNISYSLGIYQSACFFWNNKKKAFISDGCKVGPKTSLKKTHCLCKRFGAFGSLVSIMKSELGFDPIIFTVPIKKLSPIAMIMVILVLCLYALLFAWAWYKDMKDKEKDDVVHLMDNHPKFKFKYEIKVFTGLSKNAGSTANVCCIIKGEDGQTSVRALHDIERQRFQRSAVDVFLLCTPLHLGRLNYLEIWHNNDGDDPSWYLIKVSIRDILKDELYYFMCNQWLAVEHHDGQVKRNLPVAKKEEVESFKHLFTSVARNRLTEGHLWLSVFTRPSRSRFSRVQRLSCCLMYIYCAMFINSFLYKVWGQADPSITMAIGPLRISPHQIYVTLICGLLLLPINEVMVGIFRSIKAKSDDDDDDNKLKDAPLLSNGKDLLELIDWYRIAGQSETKLHEVDSKEHLQSSGLCKKKMDEKTLAVLSALHDDGIVNSPMVTIGINEESGQALKRKNARKRIKLPYHFIFLAWFYFLALSSASAYFVAHFGEQYDEELAAQWLTSFVLIIFQDIVIINVFRVAFISLYYALVLKRPDESDYDNDRKDDNPQQTNNYEYDITKTKVTFPPSKEQLDEARTKKLREIQMDAIIKDMIIYVFFLTSLLVVSYSHRDPQAFAVAQNLIDSYIGGNYAGNGLSQNDGTSNYWTWLESTVLPSLSAANRSWVPFCEPSSNYSIDCNTRIIGTARLRQLRVPPGSCEIPPGMEIVSSTCNDFYSMLSEDKSNYLKGWIPTNKTRNEPDPWTYQSMFDIGGYPYFGILSTYSGGGYITELHSTGDGINDLKTNNWIDQRTRALFVEVSVYNAQVDMFGIATFLTEWMPTNGVLYFDNVKAARLFIPTDAAQTVTTVCQLFMVLFLMIFIYGESKKVLKERKQYFKDVWNWMEVFMIVFIFGCLGSLYQRSKSTTKAISEMQKNPDKFVSLIQAATFDELLTYFLGLVVFVANLKLLKLFKFNHRVFLFTRTLSTASDPLLSFMLVFFIFYIAFCSIYYLIFGTIMVEYKSMTSTIKSLFNILLGGFDFNSMEEADRVYGPLLFFSFMMIMVMILMNTFLTILMDAFADVQGDEHLKDGELDVLDHFLSRVEKFRGRKGNKIGQLPIESENDIEDIQSESQDSSIQEEKEGEYEGDQCEKKKNIDFYDDAKGFNNGDDGNDTDDDGDDSDPDDVLGQAIKRAKDRLRIKRIEMLKSAFKFTQTLATFKPIVKERKLEEKLDDITSFFCCTALDELVLDRAYEEMVRQYVKNLKRDYFNREIKRQNDFATSWQASKVDLKQPKNAIYKYTRHVEENQS